MTKRSNWEDFKNILEQNHITKLYHFTDRDNLENIIKNGGLYQTVKARNHFDFDVDEQPFFQAEILVKNSIPLKYIKNIGNFGIPIPSQPQQLQSKNAYTARVDREHPTAFIFLVDQSVSMRRITTFNGDDMTLSEAVARIVNAQINELVERCVKNNETRHYFDIAMIGYGTEAYSAWNGNLEGRDFVTPEEIRDNPFQKKMVKEEVRTRKGISIKEVEKKQWMVARHDGSWTHMDKAFRRAEGLLENWMKEHHDKDCYPPTIINITDGEYNGVSHDEMQQLANQLKSMFTNDGNVLFFNIHVVPGHAESVVFPAMADELNGNGYGEKLYNMSSLLPLNYNEQIRAIFGDKQTDIRYHAMGVNTGMERLVKMMKIGTLSSMQVNQN